MSSRPGEQLYWHCLSCGAHETVEPTGDEGAYSLGDCEPCVSCDGGTAHVMTVKLAAAYEQGRALNMSCDDAWERAKVVAKDQPATGAGLSDDLYAVVVGQLHEAEVELDEAKNIIRTLLASAVPHPVEHPTMTAAWAEAKDFLDSYDEKGGEDDV